MSWRFIVAWNVGVVGGVQPAGGGNFSDAAEWWGSWRDKAVKGGTADEHKSRRPRDWNCGAEPEETAGQTGEQEHGALSGQTGEQEHSALSTLNTTTSWKCLLEQCNKIYLGSTMTCWDQTLGTAARLMTYYQLKMKKPWYLWLFTRSVFGVWRQSSNSKYIWAVVKHNVSYRQVVSVWNVMVLVSRQPAPTAKNWPIVH